MASCERCKTSGISAEMMRVGEVAGEKILIGPCCQELVGMPQLNYHLEFSSENGLVATAEYGGLKVEYKKSQEQLRRSFSKNEVQPDAAVH